MVVLESRRWRRNGRFKWTSFLPYKKPAIQGSPDVLTAITKFTRKVQKRNSVISILSRKYFEEVEVGDSLETAGRTVTEADIVNFSNVSWYHFYAHTDANSSLNGTIFDKTVAHGYFILSAAGRFIRFREKGTSYCQLRTWKMQVSLSQFMLEIPLPV